MDVDDHLGWLRQKFGDELRQHREEHEPKLSQEAAATIAGVSRPAYSRWERGETLPEKEGIARLDEHYGLAGNLTTRLMFLAEGQRTPPELRQWASPGKPPGYEGELYLLLRVPPGTPAVPEVEVSVDVDGQWRLTTTVGPVDETGVAIIGSDPEPVRRIIEVITSTPVMIGLYLGYPALPPDRVIGTRMVDWLQLPPRGVADPD
jgi:transcriptional regulator with XRE-family HTH domain